MEQKMKCFDAAEINEICLDLLREAQDGLFMGDVSEQFFHGYFAAIYEFRSKLIKQMEVSA